MKVTKAALMVAAEALASRMASHAECHVHPETTPNPECPYCLDRAAYAVWLIIGGRDHRPDNTGPGVALTDLIRQSRP